MFITRDISNPTGKSGKRLPKVGGRASTVTKTRRPSPTSMKTPGFSQVKFGGK